MCKWVISEQDAPVIERLLALTAALADEKARLDTAMSAGIDTSRLKRKIAQIDVDLQAAQRRQMDEIHAVPSAPAA